MTASLPRLEQSKRSKSFSSSSLATQDHPFFFPYRILQSITVTMALIFLIMVTWWITAPATMAVANALAPQIPAEGNPALSILRHMINLWGVVGVVVVLIAYGLSQAQRHDWREEYY